MNTAVDAQDTARIDRDLPCVSCGYNLRTLPESGCCPECSEAVAMTLEAEPTGWQLGPVQALRDAALAMAWWPVATVVSVMATLLIALLASVELWGLAGFPAVTGVISIIFYLVGSLNFINAAQAALPSSAGIPKRARMRTTLLAVTLLVAVVAYWRLLLVAVPGVLVFALTSVAGYARRLAERPAPGIAKLAQVMVWLGWVWLGFLLLVAALGLGHRLGYLRSVLHQAITTLTWSLALVLPILALLGTVLMFRVGMMLDRLASLPTPDDALSPRT